MNTAILLQASIRADATSIAFYKRLGAIFPLSVSTQLIPSKEREATRTITSFYNPIGGYSGSSYFQLEHDEACNFFSSTCSYLVRG